MAWFWTADADPGEDAGLGKKFATQGEAESWLGEFYPELLDAGIRTVTLYEEDRLVYGPMSLSPEG
ncbi:MAG: hypothetical protein QOF52_107 [Propionibacteriaceae bacterium]|jgi:hypothetical protein|nr:hypothetical protein [Propionibacteriaceae bacterium]MDX6320249.1 hypothetical protein [Propionibacteriaceae bacterium]